jgi:hypothetical protein
MRQVIRGILIALTLMLAYSATAEADITVITPGVLAAGRDVACVATNLATTAQSISVQMIRDGALVAPNSNTCDNPVAPALSCFIQKSNADAGATLCLFVVKTKRVIGTLQILDSHGHVVTVVPAIKP